MKKNKFFLLIFFIFFIGFLYIYQGIFLPKTADSQLEKFFLIKKGEGLKEISLNLEKEGIIKNKIFFEIYVFLTKKTKNLQSGNYLFSPSMAIPRIVQKLISGETSKERITIIEGWNLSDIAFYLDEKSIIKENDFFNLTGLPMMDYSNKSNLQKPKDFSQDYDFLKDKPKNLGLEGYLFPDTYEIEKGSEAEEIIRIMLENFGKKLTSEIKEEIKNQDKSIFEIITMASLLEKEIKTLEDKKIVAGILWKRIESKMPLQVDATVVYITGKKSIKVSIADTEIDSPYNTYKYRGLSLGPICNPGFESILASLYPKYNEYFYYLSTVEGKTIFSKTLEEHNIAKEKYLKNN